MKDKTRRRIAAALIVLATIIGFFAVFAVWAKRQVLETETWTQTSKQLLEDQAVQDQLSAFIVDAVYSTSDVQANLAAALPPRAQALAAPLAGGLREVVNRIAEEALTRPRVQELWEVANARAHTAFIGVVEGKENLTTANGTVTLDLGSIIDEVGSEAGVDVSGKIPPDVAQIELLRSDQLSFVQDMVNLLKKLAIVLPFLALGLYGAAIYVARGRRRETLRAAGIGFIVIGLTVLVIRKIAGGILVDELASTEGVKPAVQAVWEIATSLLRDGGFALFGYGIVIVLGAWLAGESERATAIRKWLTPTLRERSHMYTVIALIVLLTLWWSPTEGTRRVVPALVLVGLLIAGAEALRHQAVREFPVDAPPGAKSG